MRLVELEQSRSPGEGVPFGARTWQPSNASSSDVKTSVRQAQVRRDDDRSSSGGCTAPVSPAR